MVFWGPRRHYLGLSQQISEERPKLGLGFQKSPFRRAAFWDSGRRFLGFASPALPVRLPAPSVQVSRTLPAALPHFGVRFAELFEFALPNISCSARRTLPPYGGNIPVNTR